MVTKLYSEYMNLIAMLDKRLELGRALWLEAKTPSEKAKRRIQMDGLLDERLKLMSARDAAKQI